MHVVRGPLDLSVLASFILVIAVVFHTTLTARLVGTHLFFVCLFVSLEQSFEYADSILYLVSDT